MVSIWGIPVFWNIIPEQWVAVLLALACIAYDVFITSRAPDLRITKEELEAKLAKGRVYFLTRKEVALRLVIILGCYASMIPFFWYWFSHSQEPVLLTRVATAALITGSIAALLTLGVPVRNEDELPKDSKPVTMDFFQAKTKTYFLYMLGWPYSFFLVSVILLSLMFRAMGKFDATGAPDWSGGFPLFCYAVGVGYFISILYPFFMPLAVLERKITFILPLEMSLYA